MKPVRAAALLGGSQIYYKVTAFLILTAAARTLPPSALGELFTAMAFASIFVVTVGLGLPPLVMRRVARAPTTAGTEMGRVLGLRLVTLPVFVVLVATAGMLLRAGDWPLWAAAAAVVAAEDAYNAVGAIFLGLSRPNLNVAIGVPVQTLFVAGGVVAMIVTGGMWALVGAHVFRVVALLGAGWFVADRLFGGVRPRLDAGVLDGATPFALAAAVNGISEQVDALLMGLLTSSEEMAHYQLALRTLTSMAFVPAVVASVVYPEVAARGLRAARRHVLGGLGALVFAGGTATLILALAPGLIAGALFGPIGGGVAPLLVAMAPLAPLGFVQLYLASMLMAAGRERAALLIAAASALLELGIAVPAILHSGAAGGVLSRTLGAAIQITLSGVILLRRRPS